MFIGPVFTREALITPRRPRLYVYRSVYAAALLVLMCTAWMVLAGTQMIRNVGDMAWFGAKLFQTLAPLQLLLSVFFAALVSAAAVAQEKDRRTMLLLLITRLTNSELVLGKLFASLLHVLVLLATALPIFMLIVVFGGVSFVQVGWVFAVTLVTALVAGSLGSTIALWREKTFQTLALTAMALMPWLVIWLPLRYGVFGPELFGISTAWWATALSPMGAVEAAAQPFAGEAAGAGPMPAVQAFLLIGIAALVVLNGIAILMVRMWNPSRELQPRNLGEVESIWGTQREERDPSISDAVVVSAAQELAEAARAGHVDARLRVSGRGQSREVWDNPVLWREVKTWAYGRKVIAIRVIYILIFAAAALGLAWSLSQPHGAEHGGRTQVPAAAGPLMPLLFISLVIVNALAVNSITNERDGGALDLLLATDLSPQEFVFGKLFGALWVAKEMIVLPLLLCGYLWWAGEISLENLIYLMIGLAVMFIFAAVLGLHCGMIYDNSRTAILVSLGTIFFLFLGVITCVLMMISFSGSFQTQLAPFLAFILGGGLGLYVSLGIRNPSPAIGAASLCVPFATFYAIVSFVLQMPLAVFLVMTAAYGFTTAAMLIPALYEFDVAMGRTTGNE